MIFSRPHIGDKQYIEATTPVFEPVLNQDKLNIQKHCIAAKDKKTGKMRIFIFEGQFFEENLLVEELKTD